VTVRGWAIAGRRHDARHGREVPVTQPGARYSPRSTPPGAAAERRSRLPLQIVVRHLPRAVRTAVGWRWMAPGTTHVQLYRLRSGVVRSRQGASVRRPSRLERAARGGVRLTVQKWRTIGARRPRRRQHSVQLHGRTPPGGRRSTYR
jgi:hypothetical protein